MFLLTRRNTRSAPSLAELESGQVDDLDARENSWADELTQRRQVFIEVQKAYGYLTNPLTKVIYDEFGVPGLAVYEKNKTIFTDEVNLSSKS
jgi:hypothetical protein